MKLNKKAAMFGFCRALRKQFGELFLESRHREAPKGASGSFKATRGAMFGLDARIALAIFGALSVISGAALYSEIQEAQVTKFHTDMLEIGKAWEQYYLDTGKDLPMTGVDPYRNSAKLVSDNSKGWAGPYLNYEIHPVHNYVLKHKYTDSNGVLYLFTLDDKTWDDWNNGVCTAGENCYMWISYGQLSNSYKEIVKALDKKVDGVESGTTGSIRWKFGAANSVCVKYAPIAK